MLSDLDPNKQTFICNMCKQSVGVMNEALNHIREKHPEEFKKFMSLFSELEKKFRDT